MHVDILIFAVIAAILIYRLNSVLGTRHGDEPHRPNPFDEQLQKKNPLARPQPRQTAKPDARTRAMPLSTEAPAKPVAGADVVDSTADADGQVAEGLQEIAAVDQTFDAAHFISGAQYAFNLIVDAYARGDRAALKPLLSPKLYADFDHGIAAREKQSADATAPSVRNIKSARITAAHLGGTMAYITVEYHVTQASLTDADEKDVTDIWTFTRDTRASDPNWILIETRTAEK